MFVRVRMGGRSNRERGNGDRRGGNRKGWRRNAIMGRGDFLILLFNSLQNILYIKPNHIFFSRPLLAQLAIYPILAPLVPSSTIYPILAPPQPLAQLAIYPTLAPLAPSPTSYISYTSTPSPTINHTLEPLAQPNHISYSSTPSPTIIHTLEPLAPSIA